MNIFYVYYVYIIFNTHKSNNINLFLERLEGAFIFFNNFYFEILLPVQLTNGYYNIVKIIMSLTLTITG